MPVLNVYTTKDACGHSSSGIAQATATPVYCGGTPAGSKGSFPFWALFQFPINSSTLPLGSTVSQAVLNWLVTAVAGMTAETYRCGRPQNAWAETDGSAFSTSSAEQIAQDLTEATGWQSLNHATLVTWVNGWRNASITNNGVYLAIVTGAEFDDYIWIAARESGNAAYLAITYTVPTPTAPGAWVTPGSAVSIPKGTVQTLDFGDAGANGGPAITSYTIERRFNGGSWTTHSTGASSSGSFDSALFAAGQYEFRVKATNGYNDSAYGPTSPVVTVTAGGPRTIVG